MTLTEEQRGTVGFDLGKAREAVHTLENFAFASGKITAGQIQDVLWGARLLATSAAEIERLRAAPIEYQNALDDVQNLKEQIETFHLRRENELRQMNEISWQNKTQAARIKELEAELAEMHNCALEVAGFLAEKENLEAALVEERANKMIQADDCTQNQDAADFHHRCICEYNVKKCPIEQWWLDRARITLQAEGKIGPDDSKKISHLRPYEVVAADLAGMLAKSWQITDERIGLLEYCLETLLDAPDIEEIPGPGHSIEVLRAMLRESQ